MQNALIQKLLEIKAVRLRPQNPFQWASGMRSPIYCDNRIALSDLETRDLIQKGLMAIAESNIHRLDAIAGVATAGIAHGAILADRLQLPFLYVRAKKKDHGRQNLIEGRVIPGQRVLLVEDLISTGGSCIQAAQAIIDAGAEVALVAAIFQYNLPVAAQNFRDAGLAFQTLTDFTQLLAYAGQHALFTDEEIETLYKWKDDPQAWAAAFEQNSMQD